MALIIMDALSHQAIRASGSEAEHYGLPVEKAGRWRDDRLAGFATALSGAGHAFAIRSPTAEALESADVLVIASRSQQLAFSALELAGIVEFVGAGGGLLLMANHRHFVAPQQQIAAALGLPLRFNDLTVGNHPETRLRSHPIAAGCERLHIRNSCSIHADRENEVIACFAQDESHAFAVASERTPDRRGRVLSTADSGFMASRDDAQEPMFATASNARFLANAIAWLLE